VTDTRPRKDDKLASFVTDVRRNSRCRGRAYVFPSVLRDYEVVVPISRSRAFITAIEYSVNDASFVGYGRRAAGEEWDEVEEDREDGTEGGGSA